jgi:hypothetical protein
MVDGGDTAMGFSVAASIGAKLGPTPIPIMYASATRWPRTIALHRQSSRLDLEPDSCRLLWSPLGGLVIS